MKKWMRLRGDRVTITTGESNVYQRTVDYPEQWVNGHHVMLDTGVLVTVLWERVETIVGAD